jgi:hypothetical protein
MIGADIRPPYATMRGMMKRSTADPARSAANPRATTLRRVATTIVLVGALSLMSGLGHTEERTNLDFIEGYATAVLARAESQHGFSVKGQGGVLRVDFEVEPDVPFDTILRLLLEIDGVDEAEIYVGGVLVTRATAEADEESAAGAAQASNGSDGSAPATPEAERGSGKDDAWDIFPRGELFAPLLADPRWPHFSVSYQSYLDDEDIDQAGSPSFGETFALVRSPRRSWGQLELGFQAGVFSVFDLEASSSDLVNADYLVGLSATHHLGDFTSMLRIYHQSSHLGDEFLLRTQLNRVNLSFEVLDLLVSFRPWQWLRLYGGGGVIVHREPALDRGIVEGGIELESPRAFVGGYLRPVGGADFQFREESDWHEDVSARIGLQVEHPTLRRAKLQILTEFYTGRSPNGQFYDRRIETIGIGIHLHI